MKKSAKSSNSSIEIHRESISLKEWVCFSGLLLFVCYALYHYLWANPVLYNLSDAYYYSSLANSFHETGKYLDRTSAIPRHAVTPQNGIVFIHQALIGVGIREQIIRFQIIQHIGVLLFLLSVLVLFKIFFLVKLNLRVTLFYCAIFLSSPPILKFFIDPINDAYWIFLSLLLIYYILKDNLKCYEYFALIIIGLIIPHFRLQGSVIILSGTLYYLVKRDYAHMMLYCTLFVLSILSIIYHIKILAVNAQDIVQKVDTIPLLLSYIFRNISNNMGVSLPELFLNLGGYASNFRTITSPVFYIIYLYVIWIGIKLYSRKEFSYFLFVVIILMNSIFIFLNCAFPYRYHVIIYPFLVVVVIETIHILHKYKKLILLAIIVFNLINLYIRMPFEFPVIQNKKNSEFISNNYTLSGIPLISQTPRRTYFLFEKASYACNNLPDTTSLIMVYGTNTFTEDIVSCLSSKYCINSIEKIEEMPFYGGSRSRGATFFITFLVLNRNGAFRS